MIDSYKLLAFTKDVQDLDNHPSLDAAALKAQFDAAPNELREHFNNLIDALKSTVTGDSGAKNIGATAITDLTGADVQSLLESLKTYSDEKFTDSGGGKTEYLELSFACTGSTNAITASGTFAKTYSAAPTVVPGNITQSVSYADTISFPYIYSVSTTGFSVSLKTSDRSNNFGSGTLKMRFLVSGK